MPKLTIEFPIYTFHIDFSGHVSNIVYIQWLEATRLAIMEQAGMAAHEAARTGLLPVLTDTEISYKKELRLGDHVRVDAWISELRGASAWTAYEFFNGQGELVATARQRGVFIHEENRRPARMTAAQRALFEPFLIAGR